MNRPRREWFIDRARDWLVRAQGHARQTNEESLADELEIVWELGVANSIEALDDVETNVQRDAIEDVEATLRALMARPADPKRGS